MDNIINYFIHFYKLANTINHQTISLKYPFHILSRPMWLPAKERFQLEVTSWSRDVHGLFDYKAPREQYKTTIHQITNHCRIYRNNIHNQHFFDLGNRILPKYYDFVCEPSKTQNYTDPRFLLKWNPPKRQNASKELFKVPRQPYLVLKDFISIDSQRNQAFQGYPLQVGNILRLGLIQFTVKQIVTQKVVRGLANFQHFKEGFNNEIQSNYKLTKQSKLKKEVLSEYNQLQEENTQTRARKRIIKKDEIKSKKLSKKIGEKRSKEFVSQSQSADIIKEEASNHQELSENIKVEIQPNNPSNQELGKQQCRFCLSQQENSVQDPLISPCECKGSVRRVHLSCFMHWVNSKLTMGSRNEVKTYTLQKNRCQVCKKGYPESIKCGGKYVDLVKIQKPEGPYMLLKSLKEREKEREPQISYILIPGEQDKSITIGRMDGNEIKINDISISRKHCEIFYKKGRFFAKDLGSKFGTLLKFEKTHYFDFHPAQMQIGRISYKISPLNQPPFDPDFNEEP